MTLNAPNNQYCVPDARQSIIDTYGWTINDGGESDDCSYQSSEAFITTWKTDNPGVTAANQITIVVDNQFSYNFNIDWGDGSVEENLTASVMHTYNTPGTYDVKISGDFPNISFNAGQRAVGTAPINLDAPKLIGIKQWGDVEFSSLYFAFAGCTNLDVTATDVPIFKGTSLLSGVFLECASLVGNTAFENWQTSQILGFGLAFNGASKFNQNIGGWDISGTIPYSNKLRNTITDKQNPEELEGFEMFVNSGVTFETYDAILNGFASQSNIPTNFNIGIGAVPYCDGEGARNILVEQYGWILDDGGKVENCNEDIDLDGILDQYDSCLNTIQGAVVNANGCALIAANAFQVQVVTPSCITSTDGAIKVTSNLSDYTMNVTVEGKQFSKTITDVVVSENTIIENLATGQYLVTIAMPDALFEQTYGVTVHSLEGITSKLAEVDKTTGKVTYAVSGSKEYEVSVNGVSTKYQFNSTQEQTIELALDTGVAEVIIKGKNDCQGIFTDTISVGNLVTVYPTKTEDYITVMATELKEITVYGLDGRQLLHTVANEGESSKTINLNALAAAMYLVKVKAKNKEQTIKVIKQ